MKYFLTTLISMLFFSGLALAEPQFDKPTTFRAVEILAPELHVGPNHKVQEAVRNDGYLNHYVVDSKWGKLDVVSTPLLRKRILELNSMAQMEKLKGSKEFKSGVKKAGKHVVSGGKKIVTDPKGTAKNVGKGIGGLFRSIGKTVKGDGDGHGKTEGNTLERFSGFSKTKRQYAERFSVDPYARNEYCQKTLGNISKSGYCGGAVTSVGLGAVGGVAVSVASKTESLSTLIYKQSPGNLRKRNRKRLKKMGVSKDVADLFTRNRNYTITQQTAIVEALDSMPKTKKRRDFVKFAVLAGSPELARFRTHQSQLYSHYNQSRQRLKKFEHFGEYSCARASDGSLLIAAPVDHLLWTEELSQYIQDLDRGIKAIDPSSRRLLWLTGTLSPLAARNLAKLGWEIRQNSMEGL